jgi:lysophospholipase L1-like esterase
MSDFESSSWASRGDPQEHLDVAEHCAIKRGTPLAALQSFYRKFLGTGRGHTMLDLGCGDGILAETLCSIDETLRVIAEKRRGRVGSAHAAACRGVRALLSLTLMWSAIGCGGERLPIPDPSVRYLAFGDSGTSGSPGRGYPEILSELLELPPGTVANQGRGGETTGEGLDRLRQFISLSIYPNADTLLYWEGGADIIDLIGEVEGQLVFSPTVSGYPYWGPLTETLDRIQTNIEAAISEGQTAGLTVYVATYFSLRESTAQCDPLSLHVILPSQAQNANGYIWLLNERIRQAAMNKGAVVVDIASADAVLHADDSNFLNCNHLSDKGNEIVARLFAEALGQ